MKIHADFMLGIAVGAGAMYLLDPDRGNRRRALIRDQVVHAGNELEGLGEAAASRAEHVKNQARGAVAETRARFTEGEVDDGVLEARVRSELGRAVSNPGAVLVNVHQGSVTLRGPVLAKDVDSLLSTVRSVRGVERVENLLTVHQTPDGVPGLQGTT